VKADGQMVIVHELSELRAVRDELRHYLESRRLPADVTYALLTCVHEACTNALRHAGSPRGVRASVAIGSKEIVATVRDYGAGLGVGPPPGAAGDPDSESGRGLVLMAALMDRVEFCVDHGTQVKLHKLLAVRPVRHDRAA